MWIILQACVLAGFLTLTNAGMMDLTHPFNKSTLVWPGRVKFTLDRVTDVEVNLTSIKGVHLARITVNEFTMSEHSGTHIDAPTHVFEGREGIWHLDEIPIDRLIAPAVVIDIKERAVDDPDTLLNIEDLQAWEDRNGKIPPKSVVFLYSGWDKKFGNENDAFGTDMSKGNDSELVTRFHFPGMNDSAAQWLLEKREIVGAGTDCASLDYGPSQNFPSHLILQEANVYILEFVHNLGEIPEAGATAHIMPLLIQGGSGAPTRILAFWDEEMNNEDEKKTACGASSVSPINMLALLMIVFITKHTQVL